MTTITVQLGDKPIQVAMPENTALATEMARRIKETKLEADAARDAAVVSAGIAESFSGPSYADTASGIAATSDGDFFAVDNGDGTVTIWRNNSGVAADPRTMATTAALGSTAPGSGSALVSHESGNTAQDTANIVEAMRWVDDARFFDAGDADDTAQIQRALAAGPTGPSDPAFTVRMSGRQRYVSGDGARIIEQRDNSSVLGDAIEPNYIWVADDALAPVVWEDGGSAAKVDLTNLTINCQDNPNTEAIFRFGERTTPLGTQPRLDNLMARDAPNATAFDFNVNIAPLGNLVSNHTRDGLIANAGGTGLYVNTLYPLNFTRYGWKASLGDVTNHAEFEAPGEDSISYFQQRGGYLASGIVSIEPGDTVKTMFAYDPTFNSGMRMGPIALFLNSTGRYGDFAAPSDNGTVTASSPTTLTDDTKSWERNQWKGAAVYLSGSNTWSIVKGNTEDTLVIEFSSWGSTGGSTPGVTDAYALDYPCKAFTIDGSENPVRSGTDGHGYSRRGPTYFEAMILELYSRAIEAEELTLGRYNDVATLKGFRRKVESLNFPSIPAGGRQTLSVPFPGLVNSAGVSVTPPNSFKTLAAVFSASVVADAVEVTAHNYSGAAVDLPAGTFIIEARVY